MTLYKLNLFLYWLVKSRIAFWIISSLLLFGILLEIRRLVIHRSSLDEQDEPFAAGEVPNVEQLNWRVTWVNAEQRVRNTELFETAGDGRSPLLVVLARRGGLAGRGRLARLLAALADVRGIDAALLVVSHSVYDVELNRLVRGVRFCRVLQVYYPFSLQLHPDGFPGPDPSDCSDRNTDPFCQPRDAARIEGKHHWWWTLHFVFERFIRAEEHEGVVLFLQDDDYVTPDLLYMLQYSQRALAFHPEADLISLGRPYAEGGGYGLLTIDPWRPPFDRGLAFNRSMFKKIEALATRYCGFDDDSWSYSLLELFAGLPRGHANMVAAMAPRVLDMRGRGAAAARERLLRGALFPARVQSLQTAGPRGVAEGRLRAPPHGNGGWGDMRDQLLCLDPLLATTTNLPLPTTMPNTVWLN